MIGVVVYRSLTPAAIFRSLRESARTTGAVLFVVGTASAVSWVLTAERAGEALRQVFLPFQASPKITLLLIAAVTLVLGTAMEETTMLVLMTPILAPIVAHAGIDPVHFGLVFVLSTMIGLITPPVGITMFIACQLAGITVNDFTRAVWRPFLALVLAVIVCALWPELVLFLPNLVMGRVDPLSPEEAPVPDAPRVTQDRVESYFKELNNWGRWGHDDQRGTREPDHARQAAQAQTLIKKGRTVSLARDIGPQPVLMYHVTFPSKRERVDVVLDRFDLVYHGYRSPTSTPSATWPGTASSTMAGLRGQPDRGGRDLVPDRPARSTGITTRGVLLDVAAGRKEGYREGRPAGDAAGAGRDGGARRREGPAGRRGGGAERRRGVPSGASGLGAARVARIPGCTCRASSGSARRTSRPSRGT